MNIKLKTLGVALIAVLALSALAAPGATATAKKFRAEQNANLTATTVEETEFEIPGVGISTCATNVYNEATIGTEATQVSVAPSHAGCTTSGLTTHPTMSGCKYVFTLHTGTTSTGGVTTHTHGPMHIVCEGTNTITLRVTAFGITACLIHIGSQTPTNPTIDYKNQGSGTTRDILLTSTVTGITMNLTDIFGCPAETGFYHNVQLRGSMTLKGYKDGLGHTAANHVGIWEE